MTRSYTDIPLFKDVKPEEWSDWHWQLRNRLTTTADFDQVMNLDDAQLLALMKHHARRPDLDLHRDDFFRL